MKENINPVIFTNKANCKDCYKCLRHCPVKAIRMEDGQAYVDTDLCIYCGTCIKECPQKAKEYRNDIESVKQLLINNRRVIVTLAPSFNSVFGKKEYRRIPSLLRRLGFFYVAETAVGAYYSAKASAAHFLDNKTKAISGACPATVNLIRKYYPELVKYIIPVASPVICHARTLKNKFPDAKVVMVGPCIAKKDEASWKELDNILDAVITFDELIQWIKKEKIDINMIEESDFDQICSKEENNYALSGGMKNSVKNVLEDKLDDIIHVSGEKSIKELLDNFDCIKDKVIIEPLFCVNGCINGPGLTSNMCEYQKKRNIEKNTQGRESIKYPEFSNNFFKTSFEPYKIDYKKDFSDEKICSILHKTGKFKYEDELNCGACGYNTCRDKVIAVLNGMAELEMCIPYMRRLAERRTDKIIETSPNGIVIIDSHMKIISANTAFKKMFSISENSFLKRISSLIDPEPFEKVIANPDNLVEITQNYSQYSLTCRLLVYAMKEEKQYVGIFVNITNMTSTKEKLQKIRFNSVKQAQELLEHQIEMSQKIAEFLGENTAKSEILLNKLINMSEELK